MGFPNAKLVTAMQSQDKQLIINAQLTAIMNDYAGRKYACGREMGNNELCWSGLSTMEKVTQR